MRCSREMIEMVPAREVLEVTGLRVGPDVLFTNMRVVPALADPAPAANPFPVDRATVQRLKRAYGWMAVG